MRKFLIIGACIAGFVILAAMLYGKSCCGKSEHPKSVHQEWMKEANIEVTNVENGASIKITSDKPEIVKKIQEWARHKFGHKEAPEEVKKAEKVEGKAKDLVCGMKIDKEYALKAEYEGKTYYFCAQHCKESFLKEPAKYIKKPQKGGD